MSLRARVGKVARLPVDVREELNRRLLENQTAARILEWLNGLPEAKAVVEEFGEQPIDARNISDWRHGGFADWLRRREQVAETRELARWSVQLAKAGGGGISEGASAILAGQLLEVLEGVAEMKEAGGRSQEGGTRSREGREEDHGRLKEIAAVVDQVSKALANIRAGDHSRERLDLERQRIEQAERGLALEREKFQRNTCELFLAWYEDKRAAEAISGSGDNAEKIERLGQLMFGADWASNM